jgi:hypothetical protein
LWLALQNAPILSSPCGRKEKAALEGGWLAKLLAVEQI